MDVTDSLYPPCRCLIAADSSASPNGASNPNAFVGRAWQHPIDIETCPHCGGTLRVIACIEEPALIARILGHVQQREELNGPLTRAPPGQQEVTFNLN